MSPAPVHYRLYASVVRSGGTVIDVFDCDTDSLVDQITGFTSHSIHAGMVISPDGRRACIVQYKHELEGAPALVLDLRSHAVVARLPSSIQNSLFMKHGELLLGFCWDSALVYSASTFELVATWPLKFGLYAPGPGPSEIMGVTWPREGSGDAGKFFIFNVETGEVRDTFRIDQHDGDLGFQIVGFSVFASQKKLVALGGHELVAFDYVKKQTLFRTDVGWNRTSFEISPDETEIWLTESIIELYGPPYLGDVIVLDAATGARLDTIGTAAYRIDVPGRPIPLERVCFVEEPPKAYVSALYGRPSMLAIDSRSHEVTGALFDTALTQVYSLWVSPE